MLSYDEVVIVFKEKFPDADPSEIEQLVATEMPKYEGVAQEEKDFLSDQRGLTEGTAELVKKRAEDTYGLGVSAADRAYGAAGDVYGAAGDVYGAAKEAEN